MAKKLLIIAVASLVIGLAFVTDIINVQNAVLLYVALPLGAVCLGLFLLFRILEKEAARYDQEQQAHPAFQLAASETEYNCSKHAHGKSASAH